MEHPRIPIEDLQAQVAACRRCPLCDGRTQTVFGVGNPGPGCSSSARLRARTRIAGRAFRGRRRQYLNELLAIAGLSREDVHIANVLKCRPPSNRDPRPEEIQACTPFLREQTPTISRSTSSPWATSPRSSS
ncbi:MAG: uracil-DNA glycosylase [Adlercreutzia equolifaciens]